MAYTPTVWETGDVITAEKLNKAEQGIAVASSATASSLLLTETVEGNVHTLSETYNTIETALTAGINVLLQLEVDTDYYSIYSVVSFGVADSKYVVQLTDNTYKAETKNDYPSYTDK